MRIQQAPFQLTRPALMLVTEPTARLVEIVAAAVDAGVDIVQLRDKASSTTERTAMAASLRAVVRAPASPRLRGDRGGSRSPVLLVVNGDLEAAVQAVADGVHLPEASGAAADVRSAFAPRAAVVGRSVHNVESALRAVDEGVGYIVAGTIFASLSHPGDLPAGLDFLRAVCKAVRVPVIAIGGVTPLNARACIDAGAAGVAVLSPIMRADDPKRVAAAYRAALDAI